MVEATFLKCFTVVMNPRAAFTCSKGDFATNKAATECGGDQESSIEEESVRRALVV